MKPLVLIGLAVALAWHVSDVRRARAQERRRTKRAREETAPAPTAAPSSPSSSATAPSDEEPALDPRGSAFAPRGKAGRPTPKAATPRKPLPADPSGYWSPTKASARKGFPRAADESPFPAGATMSNPDPKRAQREREARRQQSTH